MELFKSKKNSDKKETVELDMNNMPKHIAMIMDGNGRWAKARMLPRSMGHRAGMKNIKLMVQECSSLGVKYLTLYAFSTENWKRPADEVAALMDLVVEFINKEIDELDENGVRLKNLGDLSRLPDKSRNAILGAEERTKDNTGLTLNIAINYGGRDEIIKAVKEVAEMAVKGEVKPEDIDEKIFEAHLYTAGMPDPDMIIRPSGELRLSNYLLWQSAYSELWFSNINWPDFTKADLRKAISDFQNRNRRFGGI